MPELLRISSSKLPTAFGDFLIHTYQDPINDIVHVALVMGDVRAQENVLTRVHSECLTGDIFRSMRCDCGEQLKLAQQLIAQEKRGVIVYLRNHEGRGIGLVNKIHAYDLQDNGLDTVEANIALGLPVDSRSFNAATQILADLGVKSIRLLSNNPAKRASLEKCGTLVNALVPLKTTLNASNKQYLKTKKNKLGHLLIE